MKTNKELIKDLNSLRTLGVNINVVNMFFEERDNNSFPETPKVVTDPSQIYIHIYKNTKPEDVEKQIERANKKIDDIENVFVTTDIYNELKKEFTNKNQNENKKFKTRPVSLNELTGYTFAQYENVWRDNMAKKVVDSFMSDEKLPEASGEPPEETVSNTDKELSKSESPDVSIYNFSQLQSMYITQTGCLDPAQFNMWKTARGIRQEDRSSNTLYDRYRKEYLAGKARNNGQTKTENYNTVLDYWKEEKFK